MTTAGKVFGALALLVAVLALGFAVGAHRQKADPCSGLHGENRANCILFHRSDMSMSDRVSENAARTDAYVALVQQLEAEVRSLQQQANASDKRIKQLSERMDSLARISYRQWSASHGSAKMENPK